ncbi:hypothetical protein [Ectobacillus sp. sgz5001026]|uniref:hypothetical protein n=1 Tax=Ectobacillus sp. sgz5001026 TaxID=3242473 RepID=UPI0036D433F6
MRISKIGLACFFLILLAMYVIQSKSGILFSSGQKDAVPNVSWQIDGKRGSVSFTLQNEKGEPLRTIGENEQNKFVVCIMNNMLKQCEDVKPTYIGNGTFTFQHVFIQNTTLFLYIKDQETRQELAKKELVIGPANDKQTPLTVDALLTSNIGPYPASLQFSMLKANRKESIAIQIQSEEDLTNISPSGEVSRLLIVDEKLTHLISVVPQSNKPGRQITFDVTFPEEGNYKLMGTFYLNGKTYLKSYVVKVAKG